MANDRSCVVVTSAVARTNANRVWDALGRGPNTFSQPLSSNGQAPATHYYGHDVIDGDMAEQWSELVNGTLPESVTWGESGVISEADALAAVTAGNVRVNVATPLYDALTAPGGITAAQHRATAFAAYGLMEFPPEEI